MSTEVVQPKYESFESVIANQSLYAGLSRRRKDVERKERNMDLYIRQLVTHKKYKPGVETQKRIDAYLNKKIAGNTDTV
jgi:hypothetical protein